jgi:hypothetical protein
MKHNRLKPLLEAICYAYDYGKDSTIKANELEELLRPLGAEIDNKNGLEAMYGLLHFSLEIIKELECGNVKIVEKNLKQKED